MSTPRRRRLGVVLAAGVLAGCAAAGTTAVVLSGRTADASYSAGAPTAAPEVVAPTTIADVPVTTAKPARVQVPRLGIDSALDNLGLDTAGSLERPPRWQVAGWYAAGPRPGEVGPAVIAGHVDSPDGAAVFARLDELERGDRIEVVTTDGGRETFEVDRTEAAPRDDFPTDEVYGPTPDAQLRLITCHGDYDSDGGGYQDNLVVFATLVR